MSTIETVSGEVVPAVFYTDKDIEYISNIIQEYLDDLGIKADAQGFTLTFSYNEEVE